MGKLWLREGYLWQEASQSLKITHFQEQKENTSAGHQWFLLNLAEMQSVGLTCFTRDRASKKKKTPKNQQLKPWSSEPLTNSHRRQGGGQMRHRQNLFPCHPKAQQVTQAAEYRKGFQRQRKPGFESNPCYLLAARPGASYRSLPSPLLSYLQNGDGSVYLAQLFVDIKNCVK